MEDEKLEFREKQILEEEISRRDRDYLLSEDEEILTSDEVEQITRGE